MKGLGIIKFLDLGLIESLPKLAPHGVEHHFGQGAQPWILLDLVVLQLDALVLVVLLNVLLAFGFVVPDPGWPPTGFLLDFQPGVDVVCEESFTGLVKMPHFVNVLDLVPQLDSFLQFRAAPRAGQGTLLVGVDAFSCSFPRAFGHFVFYTSGTEGKGEFPPMAVRQYGMVEVTWRQDVALDETKVGADVRVTWM